MIEMQKVKTSCCDEEKTEELITISSEIPVCCKDEFVYNKIKDEFIYNKSETNFFLSFENLFKPISLIPPSIGFQTEESFYWDSSPPFLINRDLNITNSTFLI